jgi:hypothetical protein
MIGTASTKPTPHRSTFLGIQIPYRPAYWWLIDKTVIAKTYLYKK